jgi:hypothetical protein
MILETVESTAMHAIGYDWDRHILEIVFLNGGIYHFANVPPAVFMGLLRATSKGVYFQENIRGKYLNRRLGRFRRRFQRTQTVKAAPGGDTTTRTAGPRADA